MSVQRDNYCYNVDKIRECWHRVEVGCIADVSEQHTASIMSSRNLQPVSASSHV
jgi:hypothetical protein